jgi:hypothetical protein
VHVYQGETETSHKAAALAASREAANTLRRNNCPAPGSDHLTSIVYLGSQLSRLIQYAAMKVEPDQMDGQAVRIPTWAECNWPFPAEPVLFAFEHPVSLEFLISSQSTRVHRQEWDWKVSEPEFEMQPVSAIYLVPKSQLPADADRHTMELRQEYRDKGGDEVCFGYYVHPDRSISSAVWAFGSRQHVHPTQRRLSSNVRFEIALMDTLGQIGLVRKNDKNNLFALDLNPGSMGIWGMGKSSPVR